VAVCILIPAFNAGATLRQVATESLQHGLPVVVVNDGSTDETASVVADLPVTLLEHAVNQGKGAALKTGFAYAVENGFQGVITLDADGQHDVSAVNKVIDHAVSGGFGILLASRHAQFEEMAGLRKVWNRFGVWCMRKRTGYNVTDSQSGFRYYDTQLIKAVHLEAKGYNLEMEILMKGWRSGFAIGSLSVPARVADGRSTSHFRPVRDTWNICMTFLRYI
jgi:glycosyltransferase involved in cell wall biosynthesis